MLTIICGEDIVQSRQYLSDLLQSYRTKNYRIENVKKDQLAGLAKQTDTELSLFGEQQIYVIENLNKAIMRKGSGETWKITENIAKNTAVELIDWESGTSGRELKLASLGKVKEFKAGGTVFQLLEQCYPGNLQNFLNLLRRLTTPQNEMFLYIMLVRHIRTLVYLSAGSSLSYLQSWQLGKLSRQTRFWDQNKLFSFYERLLQMELNLKTGKSIFTLSHGLEMLSCYYL